MPEQKKKKEKPEPTQEQLAVRLLETTMGHSKYVAEHLVSKMTSEGENSEVAQLAKLAKDEKRKGYQVQEILNQHAERVDAEERAKKAEERAKNPISVTELVDGKAVVGDDPSNAADAAVLNITGGEANTPVL